MPLTRYFHRNEYFYSILIEGKKGIGKTNFAFQLCSSLFSNYKRLIMFNSKIDVEQPIIEKSLRDIRTQGYEIIETNDVSIIKDGDIVIIDECYNQSIDKMVLVFNEAKKINNQICDLQRFGIKMIAIAQYINKYDRDFFDMIININNPLKNVKI